MKREEPRQCFYCGCLVSKNSQNDHFPIPKSCGGTETVPSCVGCHDMKDRFPLRDWPLDWVEKCAAEFSSFPRELRIYTAKILRMFFEDRHQDERDEQLRRLCNLIPQI